MYKNQTPKILVSINRLENRMKTSYLFMVGPLLPEFPQKRVVYLKIERFTYCHTILM